MKEEDLDLMFEELDNVINFKNTALEIEFFESIDELKYPQDCNSGSPFVNFLDNLKEKELNDPWVPALKTFSDNIKQLKVLEPNQDSNYTSGVILKRATVSTKQRSNETTGVSGYRTVRASGVCSTKLFHCGDHVFWERWVSDYTPITS